MSGLPGFRSTTLLLAVIIFASRARAQDAAAPATTPTGVQWPQYETPLGSYTVPAKGAEVSYHSPTDREIDSPLMPGSTSGLVHTLITETENGCRIMEVIMGRLSPNPPYTSLPIQFFVDGVTLPLDWNGFIANSLFSADGRHYLLVGIPKNGGFAAVLDGTAVNLPPQIGSAAPAGSLSPEGQHPAFEWGRYPNLKSAVLEAPTEELLDAPLYSPDGATQLYFRKSATGWQVVVNGKPGDAYEDILITPLKPGPQVTFSADSKHFGFIAKTGNQSFAVIDAKVGPNFENVGNLVFSADGQHYAYLASKANDRYLIVVDGKEQKEYTNVSAPALSPDGKHVAYLASNTPPPAPPAAASGARPSTPPRAPLLFAVVDGAEEAKHREVSNPQFSANGAHFAYSARDAAGYCIVMDGTPGPVCSANLSNYLTFSADGKHFAYPYWTGSDLFMMVDGTQMPLPAIGTPTLNAPRMVFSPDGEHRAYVSGDMFEQASPMRTKVKSSPALIVVIDGKPGPIFDTVPQGLFVKDVAKMLAKPEFFLTSGANAPVLFSQDGKHSAYRAGKDGREFLVIDQVSQSQTYDSILAGPVRRKDGALEYLAEDTRNGNTNLYRVVVPNFSAPAK